MQGHYPSEVLAVLVVCMSIAIAVVLIMLSALLLSGTALQRKKWIPRFVVINSILAVLFCAVVIFSKSRLTLLSVGKLAVVVLVVSLWASATAGVRWCEKCGRRMPRRLWGNAGDAVQAKLCPDCAHPERAL